MNEDQWTLEIKVDVLQQKRLYEGDRKQGRRLRCNSMTETKRAERGENETFKVLFKKRKRKEKGSRRVLKLRYYRYH